MKLLEIEQLIKWFREDGKLDRRSIYDLSTKWETVTDPDEIELTNDYIYRRHEVELKVKAKYKTKNNKRLDITATHIEKDILLGIVSGKHYGLWKRDGTCLCIQGNNNIEGYNVNLK